MKILLSGLVLSLALNHVSVCVGQKKIALVIGNSAYQNAAVLRNPGNDAAAVADLLGRLEFEVILKRDLDFQTFRQTLQSFSNSLTDRCTAFVFYAGHGIQMEDKNYLIPIDAKLDKKSDVPFETIAVELLLRTMEVNNANGLNIVVLDACRNNPFKSWQRGGGDGLAAVSPPSGSIIGFSTSPGSTSSDGDGSNGLYTSVLLEQLRMNQRIEDVFIQTRNEVERLSGGRQSPWELSRLRGKYFLNPGGLEAVVAIPDRVVPVAATGGGTISGIIKAKRSADRKDVEISVVQKSKLFDVIHSDSRGKFTYALSPQIDPFDSVELRLEKPGLTTRTIKTLPNSRGILDLRMERNIYPGRSAFQLGIPMQKEGVFYFSYRYHTPWIGSRVAFGFSYRMLSTTNEYTYTTLPGQTNSGSTTFRLEVASITSRIHLFGFDKRGFNAYADIQIPLVSNTKTYVDASAAASLWLGKLLQASVELRYLNYTYSSEFVSFNPLGNAVTAQGDVKKSMLMPSLSIHYYVQKKR